MCRWYNKGVSGFSSSLWLDHNSATHPGHLHLVWGFKEPLRLDRNSYLHPQLFQELEMKDLRDAIKNFWDYPIESVVFARRMPDPDSHLNHI